jgi:ADP-heptose:LPS heptosyltransferase
MQKVLVIRIGRLGDTILATPVIEALQWACGSDVLIDFATGPGASAAILEMDHRVNRVFAIAHRSTPWRVHRAKRGLERHSREVPYDLVINLETGHECDDFVKFIHFHKFVGRPLQQAQHLPGRHCVDTEKSIYAQLLGVDATAAAETSLCLRLGSQQLPVPADSAYIVINPGFSGIQRPGYRSHRGWPQTHWLELIGLLTGPGGLSVLVNGTLDEQQYFADLMQLPGVYSLFGSSLVALASALSGARALISVDTGTMHLAMALATPVLALFGPTDPVLTGPYSKKVRHKVLRSGVDCQPCVNTPLQKKCISNRCMTALEPSRVFDACQQLIRNG